MVSQTIPSMVRSNSCKGPAYPGKGPKQRQRAKRRFCGEQVLFGTKFLKFGPKRANLATLDWGTRSSRGWGLNFPAARLGHWAIKHIWLPVKDGAPSGRTFEDVTGSGKKLSCKKKDQMQRKNVFSLQLNMRFTQTCNVWKFALFKKFIFSQLLKPIFLSLNRFETQIRKNY